MAVWTPFAAGERITAGKLNQMVGEWTLYTPTWSADSGTTTLGTGTLTGKYQRVGNTINFRVLFEWGSTTTQSSSGANWAFSLPFAPWAGDGTVFWPAQAWVSHDDTTGYNRWNAGCYVDPSTATVVAITVNASNNYLDMASMPRTTAATTTSLEPMTESAKSGSRLNLSGSYQAAN